MELWIPITIAAAFLQNLRSVGQKHLKGVMGTTGATFVRFGFGMPFVLVLWLLLHSAAGYEFPEIHGTFLAWTLLGGLGQISAQFLLIYLFSFRNFAVGTAYSRTEPAQAAIFGLVLLGEMAGFGALIAIAVTVIGVMLISVARVPMSWGNLFRSLISRTALIGLASGTLFGVTAVAYRAASLSLGGPNYLMQATTTLAVTITFQTVIMLAWMLWRDRAEVGRIAKAWKPSLFVGFVGAAASLGWFTAMTLQQAAVVKALAQIEMIFTFASSVFFFREHINRTEVAGCLLIVAGIVLLVLL
ncbi:DMT family transporter [Nitratireductor sp. L1-7-SE]|uniref:DMT family transporter n=1 Tax=Nitratireductor rhodophyticola TaxID=2854036 RepID=A0ABS7R8V0_9HYPH|nr:EamA family transporter [Nitratireductor rhodophyticola]MBY8916810.1 DMT family transporter [Nitratireductor rhodophyticola]MBY8920761.1 DMT family transporter [Nitratireductor rhodophyticola]